MYAGAVPLALKHSRARVCTESDIVSVTNEVTSMFMFLCSCNESCCGVFGHAGVSLLAMTP